MDSPAGFFPDSFVFSGDSTAREAKGSLAVAETLATGTSTTALQCGQRPFLPAADAGVRTCWPHAVHGNSIAPAPDATAPDAAAPDTPARPPPAVGIVWMEPHLGQRPFFPADASGVRIGFWQSVQLNSMGMEWLC